MRTILLFYDELMDFNEYMKDFVYINQLGDGSFTFTFKLPAMQELELLWKVNEKLGEEEGKNPFATCYEQHLLNKRYYETVDKKLQEYEHLAIFMFDTKKQVNISWKFEVPKPVLEELIKKFKEYVISKEKKSKKK